MPEYPLVFTFTDKVAGSGFLANVTINGRALMAKEDDFWWRLGVRPAALAEKGESLAARGESQTASKADLFRQLCVAEPRNTPGIRAVRRLDLTKNLSLSLAVHFHHGLLGGAHVDFRRAFTAALFDAAAVADGFDSFKAEVERFFHERDEAEEQRWDAAGEAIRSGAVTPEPPFASLPRETPQGASCEDRF